MSLNIYNNFKKKFHRLKHKHIILYGLNYNSLEIYRKNKDFKIVGIDSNEKGYDRDKLRDLFATLDVKYIEVIEDDE